MGSSIKCGEEQAHDLCTETWCDCGCHHDLLDAHHDGFHRFGFVAGCQECTRVRRGDDDAVWSGAGADPQDVIVNGEHRGTLIKLRFDAPLKPQSDDGPRARLTVHLSGLHEYIHSGDGMTVHWPLAGLTWRGATHTIRRVILSGQPISEVDFLEVTGDYITP